MKAELLGVCLLACASCMTAPADSDINAGSNSTDLAQRPTSSQGVTVQAEDERTSRAVSKMLAPIIKAHSITFGVEVESLIIRALTDPDDPEFGYDSFDHETNTIAMQWNWEDLDYTRWLLAHELAHAFQFAFDPEAYVQEPSWIHEGWAEYAVWRFFDSKSAAEGQTFLSSQAQAFLERGAPLRQVIRNVYAFDWPRSYPTCFLTVHYLAQQFGPKSLGEFFRVHGQARPNAALRSYIGRSLTSLAEAVREHARRCVLQ